MPRELRKLNGKGVLHFRQYLARLHDNPGLSPPIEILSDNKYSDGLTGNINIENKTFPNRMEIARHLNDIFSVEDHDNISTDIGLWGWLSLFYFDQVCPSKNGIRKPGREYRHILEKGYRYQHRHLLAGPYLSYKMYGDKSRLLLHGFINQESQIHHELSSRQELITNRGIIEAADTLYYDNNNESPKAGTLSDSKAGSLFRFINIIRQLELTYDLYSMESQGIISLLPDEFNAWKTYSLTEN